MSDPIDGRLVGLTHYVFHRSTISPSRVCYLQDLFTDEVARGQGVGAALIHAVYAAARAARSTRVYWHTQETNVTARRLYDRLAEESGFIVYRHDV
jgi:GNAT superfamily N-acetyltransferase